MTYHNPHDGPAPDQDCLSDAVRGGGESLRPPGSCRFDCLYTRVVPSRAIEPTAAYLDRAAAATPKRKRTANADAQQTQDLAFVIHLCGAGVDDARGRARFRPGFGQRCCHHDLRAYLGRVNGLKRVFARLVADSCPARARRA